MSLSISVSRDDSPQTNIVKRRSNRRQLASSRKLSPASPATNILHARGSLSPDRARSITWPTVEGILNKRGEINRQWRRRYFQLRDQHLTWYKPKDAGKTGTSRGTISLEGCRAEVLPDDKFGGRSQVFEISSPQLNRSYYLQAADKHDMQKWVHAINTTSRLLRMEGTGANVLSVRRVAHQRKKLNLEISDQVRQEIGLSTRSNLWRVGEALAGVASHHNNDIDVSVAPNRTWVPNARAFVFHNTEDYCAVASGPSFGEEKKIIQVYSVDRQGRKVEFLNHRKIAQDHGTACLSWLDDQLLVGTSVGDAVLYKMNLNERNRRLAIEQRFSHRSWMPDVAPHPGKWHSRISLNAVKLNYFSKDKFCTLENNRMHLWRTSDPTKPYFSGKASQSAVFGLEWSPHSESKFCIGGLNGSLKLFDERHLEISPEKAVTWKVQEASEGCIRDIAWSPLMPFWIASAGDDGVRIWDIRMNRMAVRRLHYQCSSVQKVRWSKSHCEILLTGGLDRTLRLWNLRLSPHYLMNEQAPVNGIVVGCDFSPKDPSLYCGVSQTGELTGNIIGDEFFNSFAQYRFEEDQRAERKIEGLLYCRRLAEAYDQISSLASSYWTEKAYDKTARLLTLCSSTLYDSFIKATPKSQSKLLRELSYYISPNALLQTSIPQRSLDSIQVLRIRLALRKLVETKKYQDLLSLEEDIYNQLLQDKHAFDVETLIQILNVILPNEYLRALRMTVRLAEIFRDHSMINDFVEIASLVLYPTIYHSQDDSFETDPALVKKANVIIEKELRNPKLVVPQLELLVNVHQAATGADAASRIIECMEEARRVLPSGVILLHFNALLQQKLYDKFFILATEQASLLEGFYFESILFDLMRDVGFPRLRRFLNDNLEMNEQGEPSHLIAGALTIVNMSENCTMLPEYLFNELSVSLRTYTNRIEETLEYMCTDSEYQAQGSSGRRDAMKHADTTLQLTSKIRENKRTNVSHLSRECTQFDQMLGKFSSSVI